MGKKYKIIKKENVNVEKVLDDTSTVKELFNLKFKKSEHVMRHYEEILLALYKENAELKYRIKALEKIAGIEL